MGLFSFSRWFRAWRTEPLPEIKPVRKRNETERQRRCRFESMEDRRLLAAAPIVIGSTYLEEDGGKDLHGDTIEIKFEGGAPNTQAVRVVIDGDHGPKGYSVGDMIFDTVKGGYGADDSHPFTIVSQNGIDKVTATVEDGGSVLILDFVGFDVGEKFVFTIDVDEIQDFDPNEKDIVIINEGIDPIASGVEFQGSQLTATFKAPNYYDVSGTAEFRNVYDKLFVGTNLLITPTNPNGLPYDDFNGKRDRSTGAALPLQQTPIPVSISGYVYHDPNDNGLREAGEKGLGNVPIRVVPINTIEPQVAINTTTDANGFYKVEGLMPGTYRVIEVTQPSGYYDGKDTPGTVGGKTVGTVVNPGDSLENISLVGGDQGIEYNFGELTPASLRGAVHLTDRDGNCDGPLAKPIPDVVIKLFDAAGTLVAETKTDAHGEYLFANLKPGRYRVVEFTPAGLIDGDEEVGSAGGTVTANDTIDFIDLAAGQNAVDYEFCEYPAAKLSGHVYHDANNNARFDSNEQPIANAQVILVDSHGVQVGTQTTDKNGFYEFTGLRADTYTVTELQPGGWLDGLDAAGTINNVTVGQANNPGDKIHQVELKWGDQGVNYDFGELKPGSISGMVFSDPDEDCMFGPNDTPLENVKIELYDSAGKLLKTTFTNANGEYRFDDLAPGNYTVHELQPVGYFQGGQSAGSGGGDVTEDRISRINLGSDQHFVNYDFCEIPPATIEGIVFVDPNQNCLADANELRLANVTIRLYDAQGKLVGTTTTDQNGHYKFENLRPGEYRVNETQPTGYFQGCQVAGSNGGNDTVTDEISEIPIFAGDTLIEYNFAELPPSSLRGLVHADPDEDCFEDGDETPLAGVTIKLLDDQGRLVRTTTTNQQGEYLFDNLPPGVYTVVETQPMDYFTNGQEAGTAGGDDTLDNIISDIVLGAGVNETHYEFCEQPASQLSGYVFQDGDVIPTVGGQEPTNLFQIRDGLKTPDDKPIAGVVLELRNGIDGQPIDASEALPGRYAAGPIRTTTDANGYYEFKGLKGGRNYAVFEVHPATYIDSIDTPGTTNGVAFNKNKVVPAFVVQTLAVSPRNDAIVRIPLGIGVSSEFNNFSEVKVTPLQPPPEDRPPPKVDLPPPVAVVPPPAPNLAPIYRPELPPGTLPIYGSRPIDVTWHLSVVDAGKPRGPGLLPESNAVVWNNVSVLLGQSDWSSDRLSEGQWVVTVGKNASDSDGRLDDLRNTRGYVFGIRNGTPITGDFNGDGLSEMGIYFNGEWFIDLNGNGAWDDDDLWAQLGTENDLPVVGDWNGDGKDDIGIFGPQWNGDPRAIAAEPGLPDFSNEPKNKPKNLPPKREEATDGHRLMKLTKTGRPRADLIDHVFRFGKNGDTPVTGDWDGDGIDSIGVFRDGQWLLDMNGDGHGLQDGAGRDITCQFGQAGDIPVVGDFDGDGIDEIGVFRNGTWYIDINHNRELDAHDRVFEMGGRGDHPVVGDWDGDGVDDPGLYRDGQPPIQSQAQR